MANTSNHNSGRSWSADRRQRNKNESWEKPMSQRKKRYDNGGAITIKDVDEWDVINDWASWKEISPKYNVSYGKIVSDLADFPAYYHNDLDRNEYEQIWKERYNLQSGDNDSVLKLEAELWDYVLNKAKEDNAFENYVKRLNEEKEKGLLDIPENYNFIRHDRNMGGGTGNYIFIHRNTKKELKLPDWHITEMGGVGGTDIGYVSREDALKKHFSKEKYSKGGGINSGRDLLFKSKEPYEQSYKRKREFKKYGSNGNWFNDLFEEGGNVSYGSIKKEKERMTDELLKKCGVFFAFSNEQFIKNKTPLKEGEKYISIGGGGYMPKGNIDAFTEGMKEIKKFGKNKVEENKLAETEILYELNNHECFYTGDYSDVVDMFKGIYTHEQIRDVYNKNLNSQQQFEEGGSIEDSLLHHVLNHLASGYVGSKLHDLGYKDGLRYENIDKVKTRMIQILNERGDESYSIHNLNGLIKDSAISLFGTVNSGFVNIDSRIYEQGGSAEYSVTAYLGEVISTNTAEMALGRKINSWKDEVITIDGISYRKVFLKPEYKQIK